MKTPRILAFLLLSVLSFAQVNVAPLVPPIVLGPDFAGAKIFTYSAGTSTPLATYQDSAGTILNSNPVILDANGIGRVFVKAQSYKIVLQSSLGVTLLTLDNLTTLAVLGKPFLSDTLANRPTSCTATFTFFIQTDSPYTLFQCNSAGNGWNVLVPTWIPSSIGTAGQQPTVNPGATAAPFQSKPIFDIRDYASTQAAVTAAAVSGGTVLIPQGTTAAGDCSNWTTFGSVKAWVTIPSNVTIAGVGFASKITAARTDTNHCQLFANSDTVAGNSNIRIRDLQIVGTDSGGAARNTLDNLINFNYCTDCVVQNVTISGNWERPVNLLYTIRGRLDNLTCFMATGANNLGNSCAGIGWDTAAPVGVPFTTDSATVTNSHFYQTGDGSVGNSMLVITASGVTVTGSTFDQKTFATTPGGQDVIEVGGGAATMPTSVNILGNHFVGTNSQIRYAASGSIHNNAFDGTGLLVTQAGGNQLQSLPRISIQNNTFQMTGLSTTTLSITRDIGDTGWRDVAVDSNTIFGGGTCIGVTNASGSSSISLTNNILVKCGKEGITGGPNISLIKGNHITNVGQLDSTNSSNIGIVPTGTVLFMVDNDIRDTQTAYNTGTVCTVPTATSTTCGVGQFAYVTGGTWNQTWTNGAIFNAAGTAPLAYVNAFLADGTHAELSASTTIAALTSYNLTNTTSYGMEFTGTVSLLRNNVFGGTFLTNPIHGVGETVTQYAGNKTTSGSCSGCAANYFLDSSLGTTGQVTSTIPTGTPPVVTVSTTPVVHLTTVPATYIAAGTQQTEAHLVFGKCTLGTSCAITLAGSAIYTSATSFQCIGTDMTATNAVAVAQASGASVTFTGTGTDVISYNCIGN